MASVPRNAFQKLCTEDSPFPVAIPAAARKLPENAFGMKKNALNLAMGGKKMAVGR